MISLQSLPCDEFRVNATEYDSNPNASEQKMIRWIESNIIQKTPAFLEDPEYFISQWEMLTDEDMPKQYTKDIPLQITHFVIKGKGLKRSDEFVVEYLPTLDARGDALAYPEDRMVADFMRCGMKVYALKDTIYKKLVHA